jgi:hypothetical protein
VVVRSEDKQKTTTTKNNLSFELVEFVCLILDEYFVILLRFLTEQSVGQTDVDMVCPAGSWNEGDTQTLTCAVRKTKYPSACPGTVNIVQFQRSPTGAGYITNCTVQNATSCLSGGNPCTCASQNATHYVYEMTFIAHTDYSGYWDCYVACFAGFTPQLTTSRTGCDNKQVISK